MSVKTFKPEVWAAALLESLKKSLVYGSPAVVNRSWEGTIAEQGDSVTINSVSRPTIGDYVPNVTTITPEKLTTAGRKLLVTESKYFAFEVDDVDARQIAGNVLSEGLAEAGYGLRDVADQFVAGLYTGVQTANDLGTNSITTADQAYDALVDLSVKLDEADVPDENRYAVIPPWFHGRIKKDDRFVGSGSMSADERLMTGMVGEAAGFRLLKSNNCPNPTGDDFVVQAGIPQAITFAEQINKVEAYRPDNSFSDAIKGLHLYGAKLVHPDAIATLTASRT